MNKKHTTCTRTYERTINQKINLAVAILRTVHYLQEKKLSPCYLIQWSITIKLKLSKPNNEIF